MKTIFDFIIAEAAVVSVYQLQRCDLNLMVGIGIIALKIAEGFALLRRRHGKRRCDAYQHISFFTSIFLIIFIGPEVNNLV